ncbi:hypothetical protein GEMRC1_010241 [Eukaryota sp. GEM-RC1]
MSSPIQYIGQHELIDQLLWLDDNAPQSLLNIKAFCRKRSNITLFLHYPDTFSRLLSAVQADSSVYEECLDFVHILSKPPHIVPLLNNADYCSIVFNAFDEESLAGKAIDYCDGFTLIPSSLQVLNNILTHSDSFHESVFCSLRKTVPLINQILDSDIACDFLNIFAPIVTRINYLKIAELFNSLGERTSVIEKVVDFLKFSTCDLTKARSLLLLSHLSLNVELKILIVQILKKSDLDWTSWYLTHSDLAVLRGFLNLLSSLLEVKDCRMYFKQCVELIQKEAIFGN